ncbi:MAG: helix-turn-helix domain-containing protein [Oscillospiraceae bacterium]|jgi:hypothetical protein|nr:helix-turn-helix domain-containing protein [Oscillospiraceae bacterium]
MRELISVAEAAQRLGVNADTIKQWIRGGHVSWGQYVPPDKGKNNGHWVLRRQAMEIWLAGGAPVYQPQIVIQRPEDLEALASYALDLMVANHR